jgi:hypothetical protein
VSKKQRIVNRKIGDCLGKPGISYFDAIDSSPFKNKLMVALFAAIALSPAGF